MHSANMNDLYCLILDVFIGYLQLGVAFMWRSYDRLKRTRKDKFVNVPFK
ncbi:hypothetical protein [Legionella bononiensis]|uniref:Uncharacterized protein n=1 Tax=Legionella bononiensis TaxID=2793102 RepID=A0ABS1WA82_9GAMM|nr:hypothetical protein [Legionella bononiensis]MBL7526271.1 hypothetical protein [Legionella bononiensis]